jgi:hypothetical protein
LPAGVAAPAMTTQPPSRTQTGRAKTQWTGTLSLPDDAPIARASGSSKLPLVIGGVVLAIGAAVAAVMITRGGDEHGAGPASPPVVASTPPPIAPPVPTPAPPPPPVASAPPVPVDTAPLTFAWSHIKIDSQPSGAEVVDPALGKVIGHTPFGFKIKPSRTARQFELRAKNYLATVVELVPDRETVEHVEKLERGTGHKPTPSKVGKPAAPAAPASADTGKPVTAPEPAAAGEPAAPESKPAADAKPDEAKPEAKPADKPEAKPAKPDDDSIELKADPSRTGSATP